MFFAHLETYAGVDMLVAKVAPAWNVQRSKMNTFLLPHNITNRIPPFSRLLQPECSLCISSQHYTIPAQYSPPPPACLSKQAPTPATSINHLPDNICLPTDGHYKVLTVTNKNTQRGSSICVVVAALHSLLRLQAT